MSYVIAWLAAAIVFLGLDAIWLTTMGSKLYRALLGDIVAPQPNLPAAVAFYLLYVSGIVFFAVAPALERGSLAKVILNAAALGLVAYGTYDLTNQATLKAWDLRVTMADIAWGVFVTTVAGVAAYVAATRMR